jgi:hypothetical protein
VKVLTTSDPLRVALRQERRLLLWICLLLGALIGAFYINTRQAERIEELTHLERTAPARTEANVANVADLESLDAQELRDLYEHTRQDLTRERNYTRYLEKQVSHFEAGTPVWWRARADWEAVNGPFSVPPALLAGDRARGQDQKKPKRSAPVIRTEEHGPAVSE